MRILDRYILREYLKTLFVIVMAFSIIFIVVDIFDHLPRLMRQGATLNQMVKYIFLRMPYLIVLTAPVAILLAGLFMMDNLSKYHESIAIRAAGISIFRMVVPVLLFGLFFSLLMLGFGEFVLPKAEAKRNYIYRVEIKNQQIEDVKMRSDIRYLGKDNYLYFIGFFDGYRNKMKTIDITKFDPVNGKIIKKITALSAEWDEVQWNMKDCSVQEFESGILTSYSFNENVIIPEIDATPLDFIKSAKKPIQMNFFELRDYINRRKKIGENFRKELVELYLKISFPFANFIILLFSIPLASASVRSKGRGLIFLSGLAVCFLFLSSLRISQSLGYNGVLDPLVAAWLPNIVFLLIGIGYIVKAEV